MFGINKNGTKEKIGILLPASYPSNKVTYGAGTVEDALDVVAYKNVNNAFTANQTVDTASGTTSALGYSRLTLGNDKGAGVAGNSIGVVGIYGQNGKIIELFDRLGVTAYRSYGFPDFGGIFALTSPTVGGLLVEKYTATSLSSGFVDCSKTGYKPVFAMVTNLPSLVACRGIMWDGSKYYLRLEQWNSNQTWTPYSTPFSCNVVAGYVPA